MTNANAPWRATGIPHWQADCARCSRTLTEALIKSGDLSRLEAMSQPMWICTECGNKRCAKASDCANTCDNGAAEVAANKAREEAIKDECEWRGITRRELQQERIARFLETGELPR